jgi:regulator of replication initiation timing
VTVTEKSGNLRKDLKKDILENVSTLRKVFSKMKTQIENKSEENKKLRNEVMKVTEEMARRRDSQPVRHEAPSLDSMQQTVRHGARQVLPSEGRREKSSRKC